VFAATSLRAVEEKTLGDFRWIVWSVSPVSDLGGETQSSIHSDGKWSVSRSE
jgi:hypothetical protein